MLGIVVEREVTGTREDLQSAVRHQLVRAAAVVERNDRIIRPPDEHRRHVLGEVETVASVDPLAPWVDDRACGVDERAPRVGVAQRVQALGQAAHVGGSPSRRDGRAPARQRARGYA